MEGSKGRLGPRPANHDRVAQAKARNAEELVPAWTPERIIGGDTLLDGTDAREAGPIPARNYLGATNQMGQHSLKAVAW